MKNNKLTIRIDRQVQDVFLFVITPPNSTLWIDGVVDEETNELPVKIGTIYKLTNEDGKKSDMTIETIDPDKIVGWISSDKNYHCKYELNPTNNISTKFVYSEWVDEDDIEKPFTQKTLEKLKRVIENLEFRT